MLNFWTQVSQIVENQLENSRMKKWLITTLLILSMSLLACGNSEEVVSSSPPDLGGNTGEQATNDGAAEGDNAAATEGTTGDAAAVEGSGEAAPAGGEGEAMTEGGEGESMTEGGEAATTEGGEAATTEGGEAATDGGEAAATEGGEGGEATSEGGEAATTEGNEGGEATNEGNEGGEAESNAGATTTSPEGEITYTVQPGDTVGEIAQQFDVTIADIAAANELDNINNIKVGQTLKIVAGAGGDEATPEDVAPASEFDPDRYVTYVISYGQTLFSIAQWYGFTVDELAAYNGITDPAQIKAGEVLKIPVR